MLLGRITCILLGLGQSWCSISSLYLSPVFQSSNKIPPVSPACFGSGIGGQYGAGVRQVAHSRRVWDFKVLPVQPPELGFKHQKKVSVAPMCVRKCTNDSTQVRSRLPSLNMPPHSPGEVRACEKMCVCPPYELLGLGMGS